MWNEQLHTYAKGAVVSKFKISSYMGKFHLHVFYKWLRVRRIFKIIVFSNSRRTLYCTVLGSKTQFVPSLYEA